MVVSLLVKVECDVETNTNINTILSKLPLCDFVPRSDFHNTLLFAEKFNTNLTPRLMNHNNLMTTASRVDQFGNAIVLILNDENEIFAKRHGELVKELNATHQHPIYTPHVTIGYCKTPINESDKKEIIESFDGVVFRFKEEKSKLFTLNQ